MRKKLPIFSFKELISCLTMKVSSWISTGRSSKIDFFFTTADPPKERVSKRDKRRRETKEEEEEHEIRNEKSKSITFGELLQLGRSALDISSNGSSGLGKS